jgi:formate-dependent nitrite reductase membrane component NrfD
MSTGKIHKIETPDTIAWQFLLIAFLIVGAGYIWFLVAPATLSVFWTAVFLVIGLGIAFVAILFRRSHARSAERERRLFVGNDPR